MNYLKLYNNIINHAKQDTKRKKGEKVYYENHHITPRCMGGTDDHNNKVLLTAREHFLVHWLLVKIHDNDFRLIYALNRFSQTNKGLRGGRSHLYKYAREKYIWAMKHNYQWRKKVSKTVSRLIWITNDETNDCMRVHEDSVKEFLTVGYRLGRIILHRKPHSVETRIKQSKARNGMRLSKEHKRKITLVNRTKIWLNNGVVTTHLPLEKANSLLQNGWVRGRLKTKKG